MTKQEILDEIAKLRREIALEPFGSKRIEELTAALFCLYDMYVQATVPKENYVRLVS